MGRASKTHAQRRARSSIEIAGFSRRLEECRARRRNRRILRRPLATGGHGIAGVGARNHRMRGQTFANSLKLARCAPEVSRCVGGPPRTAAWGLTGSGREISCIPPPRTRRRLASRVSDMRALLRERPHRSGQDLATYAGHLGWHSRSAAPKKTRPERANAVYVSGLPFAVAGAWPGSWVEIAGCAGALADGRSDLDMTWLHSRRVG